MPYETAPKKEEDTFFIPVKSKDNEEGLEKQLKKVAPPIETQGTKPIDIAPSLKAEPPVKEKPIKEVEPNIEKEVVSEIKEMESEIGTVMREGYENFVKAKSPEEKSVAVTKAVNKLAA